ncbi:haloacid dehalogenase-like hydrolase [Palleronia sp. KMU-117]|uniref:haloacid dehalogenase-like hydrolase n=1 Tax=Palleronia sp. KMU-117 TaxID=3434108 RepID=UPI003D721B95
MHQPIAILFNFGDAAPVLADPLPSWNDTVAKARIIAFVESVTDPSSPDYVTPANRIAVFDDDGCLWAEQAVHLQLIHAMDRLREKAVADPSILTSDVLRAACAGDVEAMRAGGAKGAIEVLNVLHSGMFVPDFQADVRDWLRTATHPDTGLPYRDMIYQPMLELLAYLRDEGFETWVVSDGSVHFLRILAEETYGIPPEHVLGSANPTEPDDGTAQVLKLPGIAFGGDKAGKTVGLESRIGRRPIFAVGNWDGDFQMPAYTVAGGGARFAMIVHHTDGGHEAACDPDSRAGQRVGGLDAGPGRGWLFVDVAEDWEQVWSR